MKKKKLGDVSIETDLEAKPVEKPIEKLPELKLKIFDTVQEELDYYSSLLEKNPEHVSIIGGNKFYTKHYVVKLKRQLVPDKA